MLVIPVKPLDHAAISPDAVAATVFSQARAQPEESTFQAWAKMDGGSVTLDWLVGAGRQVTTSLGVAAPYVIVVTGGVTLTGFSASGDRISVSLRAPHAAGVPDHGGSYLVVELNQTGLSLAPGAVEVERVFRNLGVVPETRWQYVGTLPGPLLEPAAVTLAEYLVTATGGRLVERMASGGVVSLTGFIPQLSPAVTTAGHRINFNIALRYHSYQGRTYLHLGIPLLDGEY